MADVRSLLRQQQAARRITHPCAIYSESGKLSCILCDELVKAESLWDTHLRSKSHRSRVQAHVDSSAVAHTAPKRLLSDSNETAEVIDTSDVDTEGPLAKKRSRPTSLDVEATKGPDAGAAAAKPVSAVPRRMSGAPLPGMEIQIPSRPATPSRSAIPGSPGTSAQFDFPTSAPNLGALSGPVTTASAAGTDKDSAVVDEDEWAAFEADIAATTATYSGQAAVSMPAMTAEEVAQKKEVEQQAHEKEFQREPTSKQIEDAKEEAKRQLENEFEEMEELEARVKELKEKREAIRKRAESVAVPLVEAAKSAEQDQGEENEEASDEDDDDDDEDDWAGFRFKGAAK